MAMARNLIIRLGADVGPMTKEMKKAEKALANSKKNMSNQINGLKNAFLGTSVAIAGVGAGLFLLAKSGSNLVEAQNVVKETFKESNKEVLAWAETISKTSGLSKLNATKFVGFGGAMLKSTGLSEKASADMAKSLVQLTGDMSSFYNLEHEEMWEKIKSGITGETEPLKAIGINMSVATLEAYALSKGIKKSYQEMSEAEKVGLRYEYLLKATKDAQGDFSRTSDGFANKLRTVQNRFEDVKAELGQKLLPSLEKLLDTVSKTDFTPLINGFTWVVDHAEPIGWAVGIIGTAILAVKTTLTAIAISDAFTKLAATIATAKVGVVADAAAMQTAIGTTGAAGAVGTGLLGALGALAALGTISVGLSLYTQYVYDKSKEKSGIPFTMDNLMEFNPAKKLKQIMPFLPYDVPKHASGGLATAAHLAIVGDNKNAKRDPEVIAPLSKLTGILERAGLTGGGGNVSLIIDGQTFGKISRSSGLKYKRVSGNPRMA